jgi:hypothetical protein
MVYRDHLDNTWTYTYIPAADAPQSIHNAKRLIETWINKCKAITTNMELRKLQKLLLTNEEPFPVLSVTINAHKSPLKTRRINSCVEILLYGLGLWVNDKLKVIIQVQQSFFKNSAELKDECTSAAIPENTLLFTVDAESYYTNIPTNEALHKIVAYLRANRDRFNMIPIEALIDALYIIMKTTFSLLETPNGAKMMEQ